MLLKVGHALEEGSQMGPVSSETQLQSNLDYIEMGKKEAKLAYGGNPMNMRTPGYYMEPTLFIDGDNKSTINQEEMFGPIACVIPVKSYEEGLEVANDTIFGLSSGIVTQSLSKAADFKKNIKTGVTTVNLPTAGTDYHVPFGGRKNSSFGPREQGHMLMSSILMLRHLRKSWQDLVNYRIDNYNIVIGLQKYLISIMKQSLTLCMQQSVIMRILMNYKSILKSGKNILMISHL